MHSDGPRVLFAPMKNCAGCKVCEIRYRGICFSKILIFFLQLGGHFESMQIKMVKTPFVSLPTLVLDSEYLNTPDSDLKPFSSQNACTVKTKRLFSYFVLAIMLDT